MATTGENSWELWKDSTGDVQFTTSGNVFTPAAKIPSSTTWHHAAATYEDSRITTYFDGTRRSAAMNVTVYDVDRVRIGCDIDSDVNVGLFHGDLDDVRYYDRVLSPAEISALAQ